MQKNSKLSNPLFSSTTPSQSGPEYDGNEGVLCILITLPTDCLVLYTKTLVGGWGLTLLQRSSREILQPQLTWQSREYKLIGLKMKKCRYTNYSVPSLFFAQIIDTYFRIEIS